MIKNDLHLKRCPFCGGLSQLGAFLVGCLKCRVSFSFNPKDNGEKNEAINKWNGRNTDD